MVRMSIFSSEQHGCGHGVHPLWSNPRLRAAPVMRALQEAPLDYAGAARPISLGSVAIQELAPAERIRERFLVLPAKDGGTQGFISRPGLDWRFPCRRGRTEERRGGKEGVRSG